MIPAEAPSVSKPLQDPVLPSQHTPGSQPPQRLLHMTLGLGLLFGVVVDRLWFGHDPSALLLTLLTLLFCSSGLLLAWQAVSPQRYWQLLWSAVAVLCQGLLLLRSSTGILRPLLLLGTLAALSLFLLQRGKVPLGHITLWHCLQVPRVVLGTVLARTLTLLRATAEPASLRGLHALAILGGMALALMALAVFILLFALADAGFGRWLEGLVFELPEFAPHLLLVLLAAWIASGLLSLAWQSPELGSRAAPAALHPWTLGVLLATLCPLFLVFAGFQLANLFGAAAETAARSGLTVAEFARQGFFELLASAGLTLGLLTLLSASAPQRWYRRFAAVLLACVGIILASAGQRIALYVQSFGLSIDRVVACTFTAWIALGILAFFATVLRQRPGAFIACLAGLGIALCLLLAALNPAALVVRSNVALARGGQVPLDSDYLLNLGEDAVPALVNALPALDPGTQCLLVPSLLERWAAASDDSTDWREWTWSVRRARASLQNAAPRWPRCP